MRGRAGPFQQVRFMAPSTRPVTGLRIGAAAQETPCKRSLKCSVPSTTLGRRSSSATPMPFVPTNCSA